MRNCETYIFMHSAIFLNIYLFIQISYTDGLKAFIALLSPVTLQYAGM